MQAKKISALKPAVFKGSSSRQDTFTDLEHPHLDYTD